MDSQNIELLQKKFQEFLEMERKKGLKFDSNLEVNFVLKPKQVVSTVVHAQNNSSLDNKIAPSCSLETADDLAPVPDPNQEKEYNLDKDNEKNQSSHDEVFSDKNDEKKIICNNNQINKKTKNEENDKNEPLIDLFKSPTEKNKIKKNENSKKCPEPVENVEYTKSSKGEVLKEFSVSKPTFTKQFSNEWAPFDKFVSISPIQVRRPEPRIKLKDFYDIGEVDSVFRIEDDEELMIKASPVFKESDIDLDFYLIENNSLLNFQSSKQISKKKSKEKIVEVDLKKTILEKKRKEPNSSNVKKLILVKNFSSNQKTCKNKIEEIDFKETLSFKEDSYKKIPEIQLVSKIPRPSKISNKTFKSSAKNDCPISSQNFNSLNSLKPSPSEPESFKQSFDCFKPEQLSPESSNPSNIQKTGSTRSLELSIPIVPQFINPKGGLVISSDSSTLRKILSMSSQSTISKPGDLKKFKGLSSGILSKKNSKKLKKAGSQEKTAKKKENSFMKGRKTKIGHLFANNEEKEENEDSISLSELMKWNNKSKISEEKDESQSSLQMEQTQEEISPEQQAEQEAEVSL